MRRIASKILTMIDLKKLEAKFEALFNEETEESFNKWLVDKQHREIMAYLGVGQIEAMKPQHPILPEGLICMPINQLNSITSNSNIGSTQFAMAA